VRRRIFIAALAAVVIGVVALALSQRQEGTVEYHQQQFRKIFNNGRATRIGQPILRYGPDRLKVAYMRNRAKRLDFHRQALIKHGFLVERIFVLSSRPARDVANRLHPAVHDMFDYSHDGDRFSYGFVTASATNELVIIDTPKRMERWSNVVANIDVPE
jgi:type II secretory pathway component GspD/PulD (secretin)